MLRLGRSLPLHLLRLRRRRAGALITVLGGFAPRGDFPWLRRSRTPTSARSTSLVRKLEDGLSHLREGLDSLNNDLFQDAPGELNDERFDKWLTHVGGQSIAETVFDFLCFHQLATDWADHFGVKKVSFFLKLESWTIFPLLEMVAPEELEEALRRWDDGTKDEGRRAALRRPLPPRRSLLPGRAWGIVRDNEGSSPAAGSDRRRARGRP